MLKGSEMRTLKRFLKAAFCSALDVTPEWIRVIAFPKSAAWYDAFFERSVSYATLNDCPWRNLYSKVLSMVDPSMQIMDRGCGPGLLAEMAIARGMHYANGIDFSMEAIHAAEERVPNVSFFVSDLERGPYDDESFLKHKHLSGKPCQVFVEVLEHLKDDRRVIEWIPPGTRVVGSVPKFWSRGHVRRFKNLDSVYHRYGKFLTFDMLHTYGDFIVFRAIRRSF